MKTYLCEEEGTQFTVNAADMGDAREAAGLYGGSVIKELQPESEANLIAAAPELLNALEALKEWGCTYTSPSVAVTIEPENSPHDLLVAAVEAINKAKGGQQ